MLFRSRATRPSIITFIALIGSLMVSYVRARAEGLGLECKVGFMQRPERVVLTALGAMFFGIFGNWDIRASSHTKCRI